MRRKTIAKLFTVVVGLSTASGTFAALDHKTTALLLFYVAVILFFITASIWLPQLLSKLRGTTKTVSLDLQVLAKPGQELPKSELHESSLSKSQLTSGTKRTARPNPARSVSSIDKSIAQQAALMSLSEGSRVEAQSSVLDEQKRQILSVLFQRSFVGDYELESRLNLQENVALYHLEELRKAGYVAVEHSQRLTRGTRYSISQKGREFVIKNDLLPPPLQNIPLKPPLVPNELQTKILIAIAECGDSCLVDVVADWFEHHERLHQVKLDRNLHDLRELGYVKLHKSPVDYQTCSLTQKGREYVDDNHLLHERENSD